MTENVWHLMSKLIGSRIRELRKERGLSQVDLCRLMGQTPGCTSLGRPNLARLENASGGMATLRTLVSVARGLGVPLMTLLEGVDEHIGGEG